MAAALLLAPYPKFCCNWVSKACKVACALDPVPDVEPVVPVELPAPVDAVEDEGCISAVSWSNALCKLEGADPLLTCEMSAVKPAAKLAFGSEALEPVADALLEAFSLFTA